MQGVTESKAKEIFKELWANDEFDWDFEGPHFCDRCNRSGVGLDVVQDAKYDLLKARENGKQINNELNFFWGCAQRIQDKHRTQEAGSHRRGEAADKGCTPEGFNSYQDYFNYLCRKVQEDFPDTPEQVEQRIRESSRIER